MNDLCFSCGADEQITWGPNNFETSFHCIHIMLCEDTTMFLQNFLTLSSWHCCWFFEQLIQVPLRFWSRGICSQWISHWFRLDGFSRTTFSFRWTCLVDDPWIMTVSSVDLPLCFHFGSRHRMLWTIHQFFQDLSCVFARSSWQHSCSYVCQCSVLDDKWNSERYSMHAFWSDGGFLWVLLSCYMGSCGVFFFLIMST